MFFFCKGFPFKSNQLPHKRVPFVFMATGLWDLLRPFGAILSKLSCSTVRFASLWFSWLFPFNQPKTRREEGAFWREDDGISMGVWCTGGLGCKPEEESNPRSLCVPSSWKRAFFVFLVGWIPPTNRGGAGWGLRSPSNHLSRLPRWQMGISRGHPAPPISCFQGYPPPLIP